MATTEKGIYYPADYDEVADIPDDMKKMAESIDDVIEHDRGLVDEFVEETNQKIETIQAEQTTQNENIQENTDNIEALETKHDTEVAELNEKITELETDLEMATDIIPTGDASGSDITLSDSARYKFKKMVLGGKSEQESYTGKNIVKSLYYRGASTLNFYINEKKVVSSMIISGITNVSVNNMTVYLKFGNVTYTLATFNMVANQKFNVSITLTEEQINAIKEAENVYIQLYRPSASSADLSTCTYDEIMLRDSSTTDSYEPYTGAQPAPNPDYECPIQNVTGNVEVKVENKNILKLGTDIFSDRGLTTTKLSDGGLKVTGTTTRTYAYIYYDEPINLLPGTYTFSIKESLPVNLRLFGILEDGTQGENITISSGTKSTTKTLTEKYVKIRMLLFVTEGTNYDLTVYPMLEQGSTTTDFIEHEEQTAIFPLEEGQRLHLTDVISDKIVQKRKTIVFDGTENWKMTIVSRFYITVNDLKLNLNEGLCSHFKVQALTSTNGITFSYGGIKNIYIYYDGALTVLEFKAWLAEQYANGTPVIVEYELETPIEISFTEAQKTAKAQIDKLISYKGTTHITSEANLDVTYRKDLETIIDNLSNAIVAQGGI